MRILCVDDEADIRTILGLALSLDPDFDAEIVATGAELLERASGVLMATAFKCC